MSTTNLSVDFSTTLCSISEVSFAGQKEMAFVREENFIWDPLTLKTRTIKISKNDNIVFFN